MATLRALLANCLVHGEILSEYEGRFYRDTIQFNCDGRVFSLTQNREVLIEPPRSFAGHFCQTSELAVDNVEKEDVEAVLEVVDRICWLLSLACMSRVTRYGHDYGGQPRERRQVFGVAQFFRPTFETANGAEVRGFVDQVYPAFVQLQTSRKLPIAIDYALQADRPELPVECRLMFAFVLLENLKFTYAHSKGIDFIKGRFREGPSTRDKEVPFKAMLERMFGEVGMTPLLEDIVALRNDIVHSGISTIPLSEQQSRYEVAQDLIREYILRLLAYRGSYCRYATAGRTRGQI